MSDAKVNVLQDLICFEYIPLFYIVTNGDHPPIPNDLLSHRIPWNDPTIFTRYGTISNPI